MIVKLTGDFRELSRVVPQVATIVRTVVDGWHDWYGPDPDDQRLDAYYALHPLDREVLRHSFVKAVGYGRAGRTAYLIDVASDTHGAHVDIASQFLRQPLEILVENEVSDGQFFARVFAVQHPNLKEQLAPVPAPLRFTQGGGFGAMPGLIRLRATRAAETGVPMRVMVLIDSDAKYPSDPAHSKDDLRSTCSELGVTLLILQRRAIENYLSDRILSRHAGDSEAERTSADVILSLSPLQRDHFPIRKGMEGRRPTGPEAALYEGADIGDSRSVKLPHLTMNFLADQQDSLTAADLRDRNVTRELHAIAEKILEEL